MTAAPQAGTYGRYQLLEAIGHGSMAEVFKAKSFGVEGFEKTLVVKRIVPELARERAFVEPFVGQAKLAVRLSHANVVQVFDLGRVDGPDGPSYFMATEYVAGLDLATLLRRVRSAEGRVPAALSVFVASEIAKALDHAHRRRDEQLRPLGVVHGDLGPQNVLVSWEGEVKVADFAVAAALYAAGESGAVGKDRLAGKLRYASPEMLRGEPLTPRSDLFSFGALLYEVLAGRSPFEAPTADETRRAVLEARFTPLDQLRDDLSPELVDMVHRALSRDPEQRFDTAAGLYEDLLAHLYSSGARFGAADLAELVERFREPLAPASGALLVPSELESVVETPPGGTPAPAISPLPSPPSEPVPSLRGLSEHKGQQEASALVLRFSGNARVPPAARERARKILERYGARVLSDAEREVSAMFGLEQGDARDTENAVRCGLVLVRSLAVGNVQPGVGIDAGRLWVDADGAPGDDERTGALLDAARRLAENPARRVAISEAASPNLRGLFTLELLDGGGYLVGEVRPVHDAFGRFVGRKKELRQLGEIIAEASRRQLQVVGVVGDHGVGKTRLVYEMERRISRGSFNIACYVAACPPRGHESPGSGTIAMLRTLCGVREGDPPDRILGVLPRLRALGLREEEAQSVLAQLGAGPATAPAAGDASLRATVARMIASLAEDRLHVFVWDNAQEMDAETAALLGSIAERLPLARAVLLLASRPNADATYRSIPGYEEIALPDLEDEDVFRLAALRLGVDQVPEALLGFLKKRAGGHPMFLEELMHEALESGAVVVRNGRVETLTLDGALAIPRPLRTLLGDRVRRLPEPERDLVIAAAVVGAPADTSVLAAMLDAPLGTVNALAESLEARELVRREGPVALDFLSPLLPEVVLSGLEPDVLLELHQEAANAYQMVLGERTEEEAGRIAFHLAEAGQHDRAASFYATSGLFSLNARRLDHAVSDLSRALVLCDLEGRDESELAEWVAGLSRAVRHVRSGAGLPAVFQRLGAHLETNQALDDRLRVQMTIDLALMQGSLHRYRESRRLLERAAEGATAWPELSRSALTAEAEVAIRQGEFRVALRAMTQAEQLGKGDALEQHRLLVGMAQALGGAGDHDRALGYLDQAAALAPEDDIALACERTKVRSLILYFRGDWAEGAKASQKAAELGRAAGLVHEIAVNLHNQGDSLMRLDDLPRAYATLQASLDVAEEIASERLVNLDRLMLAYLDAINGSESAFAILGERLAYAEAQRWTWDVASGRYLLGKLLAQRGDRVGARRELTIARQMGESTDNQLVVQDCDHELSALRADD